VLNGIAMRRALSETRPIPRRWLNRIEAAIYTTFSPSKFDELVRTGRMPPARRIDGRLIWDLHELDLFIEANPRDDRGEKAPDDDWQVAV
jgi:predicted DNA-binding transcriptional regulator AlpA